MKRPNRPEYCESAVETDSGTPDTEHRAGRYLWYRLPSLTWHKFLPIYINLHRLRYIFGSHGPFGYWNECKSILEIGTNKLSGAIFPKPHYIHQTDVHLHKLWTVRDATLKFFCCLSFYYLSRSMLMFLALGEHICINLHKFACIWIAEEAMPLTFSFLFVYNCFSRYGYTVELSRHKFAYICIILHHLSYKYGL